ncbi:hypothetical protein EON63_06090 [archaeon]|nr:MAG: hypothetical protein EON63_06090 [archaeon]
MGYGIRCVLCVCGMCMCDYKCFLHVVFPITYTCLLQESDETSFSFKFVQDSKPYCLTIGPLYSDIESRCMRLCMYLYLYVC